MSRNENTSPRLRLFLSQNVPYFSGVYGCFPYFIIIIIIITVCGFSYIY